MNSAQNHSGLLEAEPRSGHRWRRTTPRRKSPEPREPVSASRTRRLEDVWDRHGAAVYALACAVLGDEECAREAVTLGMADFARSGQDIPAADARRALSHHVYLRSQKLLGGPPGTHELPAAMVWIAQLAPLQRACLALCCFGGHTHREAAALLGVSPATVAELLTAGLRELTSSPGGGTAS